MNTQPPHTAAPVMEIVKAVEPFFAGRHPGHQGAALADLLATWLAGWPPQVRERLLALHIAGVRRLVPVNAAIMGTGQ